jgi:Xaa-Pro aminopeptidase
LDKIRNRLVKLKKILSDNALDALMVLTQENRFYLSGFSGEDTQFDESAGALFITQKTPVLATDSRFVLQAETEASLFDIVCYKEGLAKELPNIIRENNIKRLGFESGRMSYLQYRKISDEINQAGLNVNLIETEHIVENFRLKKDQAEISLIQQALAIAESAFASFQEVITAGMTEKTAAWLLEKSLREAGADAVSFSVICASGENSAMPHAIPQNRKLKKGEPILFDWGAKLNGYCSDISRTLCIGKPDETFKKVFNTVYDAQRMAIDAIKPGMTGKQIDGIARSYIEKKGFKGKFSHGLGHGIGLAVHEMPGISPLKEMKIEPHMVFTVEPGIYLPGWGGVRLENMVVVNETNAEVLNNMACQWN